MSAAGTKDMEGRTMMAEEYPPKSVKVALVRAAILWIGTIVGLAIHLNNI